MYECKNRPWLMAMLLCCAFSTTSALADSPIDEPLKQSNEKNAEKPTAAAPAKSVDVEKSFAEGSKANNEGDYANAMSILKPAADAGHAPSQALFAYILEKSAYFEDAAEYYRRAAKQGNADGQYGLAILYLDGNGIKQDIDEARRLLISAGDKGHAPAVNVLATAYAKGGLNLDDAARQGPEALPWIKRAAGNNDLPSIDVLVDAYLSGKYGLKPDPKKAEEWIAKAKKLRGGDPPKKKKIR